MCGFPQPARAKLEAHQRRERGLGGTTRRAAALDGLGDGVDAGETIARIRGDHIDPSLDEGKHGFEAGEGNQLLVRLRRDQCTTLHRFAQLFRVGRVEVFGEGLKPVGVDADAAGELRDRGQELKAKPLRVTEESGVGELAHGKVELNLVDGNVEAGTEGRNVLRDQGGLLVVEEGDAHVATGNDLGGKLAHNLAELHGEQGSTHVAHELARALHHFAHFLGSVLLEHVGEGVGDRRGYRFGKLGPHRHGGDDPFRTAHQARSCGELGQVGDLVEPQGRDVEGLLELRALGGQRHHGGARGETLRLLEGEAPVDAVFTRLHGVLQLSHQLRHHFRIVGESRGARKLRRIDVGIAREELAQHVSELVARVLPRIISHTNYASRCTVVRPVY